LTATDTMAQNQGEDKEMIDNASTATWHITNTMMAKKGSNKNPAKTKKQQTKYDIQPVENCNHDETEW